MEDITNKENANNESTDFENEQKEEMMSAEARGNMGIALWKMGTQEDNPIMRREGVRLILEAFREKDIEATAYVGYLLYMGQLRTLEGDSKAQGMGHLHIAALRGSTFARTTLNRICFERYSQALEERKEPNGIELSTRDLPVRGPLRDFEGKVIKINKTGLRAPVDAVLEYKDGKNFLQFSVNLLFLDYDVPNAEDFRKAVISGIKEWEGKYEVFGGQELNVAVEVTTEERLFDNVKVFPITEDNEAIIQKITGTLPSKKGKKAAHDLLVNNRSAALVGLKWSATSRKTILISTPDRKFDDLYEIKHVAKHEFGHALGLGDLYANESDNLGGVKEGTFFELDGFYTGAEWYNLVMCDHHGPISNNDIEMVVLAFSNNEAQLYQKDQRWRVKDVSKALGVGN